MPSWPAFIGCLPWTKIWTNLFKTKKKTKNKKQKKTKFELTWKREKKKSLIINFGSVYSAPKFSTVSVALKLPCAKTPARENSHIFKSLSLSLSYNIASQKLKILNKSNFHSSRSSKLQNWIKISIGQQNKQNFLS